MANTWFNEDVYLANKLKAWQAEPANAGKVLTMDDLKKALADNNLTAEQHFELYGAAEGLSPNEYFNVDEYLEAQVVYLNNRDGVSSWTKGAFIQAVKVNGLTLWSHFQQYGWNEVNPSSSFDTQKYFEAKLIELKTNEDPAVRATWADKKVADVKQAFKEAGIDPVSHYFAYGKAEGVKIEGNAQVNPGQTFTLTTGADNFVGTAGNDTIRGDNTTLQATDVVKGGAGTDTFEYTDARATAVAGDKVPAALVSEVEVINVRNVNGTAGTAAVKEVVTLSFSDYTHNANSTITFSNTGGPLTLTLSATATGADIAAQAAALTFVDYDVTGISGNTITLTAKAAGVKTDVTASMLLGGTSTGGTPAVAVSTQGAAAVTSTGANIEVTASNFAGATEFNSVNSTSDVTFTGLAKGQAVGMKGNGTVTNANVTFTMATANDAVKVNIADGTKAGNISYTAGTATTATINSTGAANVVGTVDLANATLTSVTVNAATNLKGDFLSQATDQVGTDGAVTIAGAATTVEFTAALDNTIKTIDASGLTAGGFTAILGTGVTSFKGGQGNDVVTTAAFATPASVSVDAGAGTADVLVVNAATDTDTAAEGAIYKGFEVLRTGASQNMAHFTNSTITAIQMNAATSATLSNVTAAQAANITVRGDQTTAFTVTLADATGTADVVGLTLSNPTATATAPADVDVAGLSIAGVETLNITSSGGDANLTGTQLNSVAFANGGADKLKSITVAGASSLDLNLANTAVAVTVTSAQTGTGSLKVAGNVIKGSSITATANKDDIIVTAQADGTAGDFITYDAGAGDDAISATAAAINNSVNTKASVKIDGGAGTDTLTFTDTGAGLTLGDAQFQYVTNVEKFAYSVAEQVTIATGGFFDTNYKAAGAEFTLGESGSGAARSLDASSFTGNLKVGVSNFGTTNVSTVKTGSGNDTITLTQGTTINTTTHVVEAGLGNDTIIAKNAFVTITGGKGADVIDITDTVASRDIIKIAAGDSVVGAHDKITGYATNATTANSDVLDLAGTGVQGNVAAADGVDSGIVKSHSITGGIIKFDIKNAYDTELKVNASNLSDVLNYLKLNVTTDGNTVAFAYDSDNNGAADATIVFQAAADQANATVVELVGLTGLTSIDTTGGANVLLIA